MIGQTIAHYRVTAKLGAGGMGEVYRATDSKLGRDVALKFLPAELARDTQALERFQREARAAAALNHPNICVVHEIGEHAGQPFIAMELLKGQTLRQAIDAGSLDLDSALDLALQIVDALDAAHSEGILHRDIKPANIFVTERCQAKLLDFGLAKLAPGRTAQPADDATRAIDDQHITNPGITVGTAAYMSPEQARGKELDARSDIFSFGLVLYEMFAGRPAFQGDTMALLYDAILNRMPPTPSSVNPLISAELDRILTKATEKDRDLRYQHASDLRADLKRLRRDATSGRSAAAAPPLSSSAAASAAHSSDSAMASALVSRHKGLLAGVAIAALLLLAIGYGLSRRSGGASGSAIQSVAVLPFENVGGNADTEYLSDGVAESLLNYLTKLPNLRVVSRSTAFSFKGKSQTPREFGRTLGVDAVITGRVQQRGAALVVSTEMIRVENDAQLWGERYDRSSADLLAVQNEISQALEAILRPQVKVAGANSTIRQTSNPEAYQLYLRGRFHWNKRTRDGVQKGLNYFRQAAALDPNYALAHVGIADSYQILGGNGYALAREVYPPSRTAAAKALELDPALGEAHISMAMYLGDFERDYAAAEKEFQRALALSPAYSTGHQWYGNFLLLRGRTDEAVAENRKAVELDPLSPRINLNLGDSLSTARRFDEAIAQIRKAKELGDPIAMVSLVPAYIHAGKFEALFEELKLGGVSPALLASAREAYQRDGRFGLARVLLKPQYFDENGSPSNESPAQMAYYWALAGDKEKTLSHLERAIAGQDATSCFFAIKSDSTWDWLRSEPRFQAVLRQLKLAD